MAKTTDLYALRALAEGLAALAARLEPKKAAQAAATLARAIAKNTDRGGTYWLAGCLATVAARLEPKEAAAILSLAIAKTTEPNFFSMHPGLEYQGRGMEVLARGLAAVLTPVDPRELSGRAATVVAAVGCPAGCGHLVSTPALLRPALAPLPCSLSTPDLVELLKQPTCVGRARRVILDQLENRYRRPFADQWAFVRFAKEQKLGLDFTSPPQRPVLPATGEKK
jgi:hypothetical protein